MLQYMYTCKTVLGEYPVRNGGNYHPLLLLHPVYTGLLFFLGCRGGADSAYGGPP